MKWNITKEDIKIIITLLHKEADETARYITHPLVDEVECVKHIAHLKSLAKQLDKQLKRKEVK